MCRIWWMPERLMDQIKAVSCQPISLTLQIGYSSLEVVQILMPNVVMCILWRPASRKNESDLILHSSLLVSSQAFLSWLMGSYEPLCWLCYILLLVNSWNVDGLHILLQPHCMCFAAMQLYRCICKQFGFKCATQGVSPTSAGINIAHKILCEVLKMLTLHLLVKAWQCASGCNAQS